MNIEVYVTKLGQCVKMTDLYDFLELDRSSYAKFVKAEITESPYFDEEKDYSDCGNPMPLSDRSDLLMRRSVAILCL